MTDQRHFPVVERATGRPPDYERVVRVLSDADLEDEILGGRGENGYRLALVEEHERRSRSGSPS